MMTTPERFEDRLLRELRQVVAERPAPATGSPRRTRRTRLALGGVGVAAATVAIAVIATGSDVTPNAYAVESHANGAVTVSISALRDATGLQSSLRAAGVPAVVDYSATGPAACPAPPTGSVTAQATGTGTAPTLEQGGGTPGPATVVTGAAVAVAKPVAVDETGAATLTIAPGQVKPGEHVYITSAGASVGSVAVAITAAAPGAVCVTGAASVSAGNGPDTAPAPTPAAGQ